MGLASLGKNIRISDNASIYDADKIHIGDNSRIDDFCVVSGRLDIGRNVFISAFGLIAGGSPGITLEDFVCLSYHVQVFSQSDDYSGATIANATVPKRYRNDKKEAVRLYRHRVVGAGSIITPGVTVAEGTSIGAASLVLAPTEAWSIYVGSPARKLKDRKRDLLALAEDYIRSET